MNIKKGEKRKVKAAPASIYYKFNNLVVTIINVFPDENDKMIYVFKHNEYGLGAMYSHGFSKEIY